VDAETPSYKGFRFPGECRRHVKTGSGSLSVIVLALLVSGGEEDAFAEQVEFGAAIHLSLDHFDAVDVAFHGS
jgi:hypothetical protein